MKVLITGGSGMVGRSLGRIMTQNGKYQVFRPKSTTVDFCNREQTNNIFSSLKPDYVVHLAARVGGLADNMANQAEFFEANSRMALNVLSSASLHGVKKTVSLLSSCIYPDRAKYPLQGSQLHDGPPHPSNYGYAHSKRLLDVYGRALNEQQGRVAFISLVPNNLFGPHDQFARETSHFIPSLIRKIHEHKTQGKPIVMWGTGKPEREFTYVDDLSEIILLALEQYEDERPLNVGNPINHSIRTVVEIACKTLGVDPNVVQWDLTKPDGQFKKPTSPGNGESSLEELLGWKFNDYTPLTIGLWKTYKWYEENYPNVRGVE